MWLLIQSSSFNFSSVLISGLSFILLSYCIGPKQGVKQAKSHTFDDRVPASSVAKALTLYKPIRRLLGGERVVKHHINSVSEYTWKNNRTEFL